ncbi:hypothetical protein BGZ63DRAFT_393060 [Mariannaea sp. PMI_226]|nr:hypothetical protein BGZ63DRAFT_393060 [Mariannaea sp. PMI_226]
MPENLAKSLGKSLIEGKTEPVPKNHLHDPKVWDAYRKAWAAGWRPAPIMKPIVIGEGTIVESPQHLRDLVGAAAVPEVMNTKTTFEWEEIDEPVRDIKLCLLDLVEWDKLTKIAELEDGPLIAYLEGAIRQSYRVSALKLSTLTQLNNEAETGRTMN